MNGLLDKVGNTDLYRSRIKEYVLDSTKWHSINSWNSYVLENPISPTTWTQLKAVIDSYYDYGEDCNRILVDQIPGYMDNSLFTFKSYLDHNWESIALDQHCCYAHNLVLEFIGYIDARIYGVLDEHLQAATDHALELKNGVDSWNINQIFDYYTKQYRSSTELTRSKFGGIVEFFPFNCIREMCRPKHLIMIKKLCFVHTFVHLLHKLHLRTDSSIKINIAGFDHLSNNDLSVVFNKKYQKCQTLDFLNYTFDDDVIDEEWVDDCFRFEDLDLFQDSELDQLLTKPFEIYFSLLQYFLSEVLPEMSNNRVILPFAKRAKNLTLSLTKSRIQTAKGQKPYLLYFEKQLVFGYLLSDNLDQQQAARFLHLLSLPKSRGLDQVIRILQLDPSKSTNLTKQSVRYIYELYKEQYNDLFTIEEEETPKVEDENITNQIVEDTFSIEKTLIRKKTKAEHIDRSLFIIKENYINFDAFRFAAVKRTFSEVERILKIAISIHHDRDTVLDAFRAIIIHPELYGIGASLLNNKVKPFHEYTNRMRAGDLEIKLSEEFRLFLRDSDGNEAKVEIVELSNPKYHH
jgi:hypothetical protein